MYRFVHTGHVDVYAINGFCFKNGNKTINKMLLCNVSLPAELSLNFNLKKKRKKKRFNCFNNLFFFLINECYYNTFSEQNKCPSQQSGIRMKLLFQQIKNYSTASSAALQSVLHFFFFFFYFLTSFPLFLWLRLSAMGWGCRQALIPSCFSLPVPSHHS